MWALDFERNLCLTERHGPEVWGGTVRGQAPVPAPAMQQVTQQLSFDVLTEAFDNFWLEV